MRCGAQIGRRCEAADVQVSWVSPEGAQCVGAFKVLNASPNAAGQWFSVIAGVWGPADDLTRHLWVLDQASASLEIGDESAKLYIENGLANLRKLRQ